MLGSGLSPPSMTRKKGNRSTGWRRSRDMFVSTCCGAVRASPCRVWISKPSRKPFPRTTLHRRYRPLQLLEVAQSKAILMAFHFGSSHVELAKTFAVPLGMMKPTIRRGLARLKECLDAGDVNA